MSMAPVLSAEDEDLYVHVADRALDRLNRDHELMQKLYLAFIGYRTARTRPADLPSERFGLACALTEFHRWRMGRAVGAIERQPG